jgi:type IV secretory pathway component VirB8
VQNRVEPPILLSRLLTLVFATTLVVLAVLSVTLYNLFPLDRPEVFFLRSSNTNNTEITLTQVMPEGEDLERYKRAFITEYIKNRNEITQNVRTMEKNWGMQNGVVKTTSTDDIFAEFANTSMYQEFLLNNASFNFSCSVEFPSGSVNRYTTDGATYTVDFKWFCTNSYGQTDRKDYRIKITLATDDAQTMKWADHMENPLGLRVAEYSVESGDGDPLDAFVVGNE